MMYVSRFWLSTCRRKPNGVASIDWRMLSSAAAALLPSAFWISDLGQLQPAAAAAHRWIGLGELLDHPLLLVGGDRARAGDLDRHLLDLLRVELGHQLAGLLFGQRHQQDGGVVNVGHGVSCECRVLAAREVSTGIRRDARRSEFGRQTG